MLAQMCAEIFSGAMHCRRLPHGPHASTHGNLLGADLVQHHAEAPDVSLLGRRSVHQLHSRPLVVQQQCSELRLQDVRTVQGLLPAPYCLGDWGSAQRHQDSTMSAHLLVSQPGLI